MSDYDIPRLTAWNLVNDERNRQEALKRSGKFRWTLADEIPSHSAEWRKFAVLSEEVGEVARAINECDGDALIREVTEVAACAVAWLESFAIPREDVEG